MPKCFSFTAWRDSYLRASFVRNGLRSTTTDFGDGTVVHCWVPSTHSPGKPSLVCIHGFGANAMWHFGPLLSRLTPSFNLYIPDLIFFGDSYTNRSDRSTSFQARCIHSALSSVLSAHILPLDLFGVSYGGFVAYKIAEIFPSMVRCVVLASSGICLREDDIAEGMFHVKSVEEAVEILLPRTPEKIRQLIKLAFHKPPPPAPSCFLKDFIEVMCEENWQEKKELIFGMLNERKEDSLARISQPTLVIWGDDDKIFPMELAHRLTSHLGDNSKLAIIKNAGHFIADEKPKELLQQLTAFLLTETQATDRLLRRNH